MPPTARRPPTQLTQASKIGQTSLGNRAVASAPLPDPGPGQNQAQVSTYFTKAPVLGEPTSIIYNGDRLWARVTLTLEGAGPVAVGTMSKLTPVLGGSGQLLETGVPLTYDIAKGTRLYIAAAGVNRVKLKIEALPWLEQITGLLRLLVDKISGLLK